MDISNKEIIKTEPEYGNNENSYDEYPQTNQEPMVVIHTNNDNPFNPNLNIKNEPELNLIDILPDNNETTITTDSDAVKYYNCGLCEETFDNYNDLEKHVNNHENFHHPLSKREQNLMNGKSFPCKFCTRIFAWPSHLKYHMYTHTGEKGHLCPMCFKSFTRSSHLNSHMLLHTGEKPFKCTECQKSFSRQSHLKSHTLLHTNEKRNVCEICSKSFTQPCSLKAHKLIHSGERPHRCNLCSKTFTQNSNLKAHLMIHDGLKQREYRQHQPKKTTTSTSGDNDDDSDAVVQAKQIIAILSSKQKHKCGHCRKSFAKKRTLTLHLFKVHQKTEIELNFCAKCMETYPDEKSYNIHLLQVHNVMKIKMESNHVDEENDEHKSEYNVLEDSSVIIKTEPEITIKEELEDEDNTYQEVFIKTES